MSKKVLKIEKVLKKISKEIFKILVKNGGLADNIFLFS